MKRVIWIAPLVLLCALLVWVAQVAVEIGRQSRIDEAQPADVILVLGAAEYRGKPSPVFRARLDHGFDLFQRKLAPRIVTTGGAGGDPMYTEGAVGRAYLIGRGVPSIVVSDGYHIYRVKKMLEFSGLTVYGSPRAAQPRGDIREQWQYVRQAVGYVLWRVGVTV